MLRGKSKSSKNIKEHYNIAMRVKVLITPKEGLLDPEGRAVKEILEDNGYKVKSVRVGKVVELEVEDPSQVKEMVEKFLYNPLIEEYVIE
jgi:phosphoribosylformylglycinamidine synthase PurS subunit